jgi:hypothetical protein
MPIKIGCVVEGHGEVTALPILIRRPAAQIDPTIALEIPQPIRRPRNRLVGKPDELERAVGLAALKVRPHGAVLVLIDADADCPARLAPPLKDRADKAAMGLPVSVVLARREYEAWFLAAALSLRGKRGLSFTLTPPERTEEIRGAKEWLNERMEGHTYSETIDQAALTGIFDLQQARAAPSFDKFCRELERLIDHLRQTAATNFE